MTRTSQPHATVGVLALQGAFVEHVLLLQQAVEQLKQISSTSHDVATAWDFIEVRTVAELTRCDALIIPGGESTTMSLVAARSNLLEALRDFVKVHRKPVWGTCAGLILLAESANRTKRGGQDLIGGLDVRVNRNHFGRQVESFQALIDLPFLAEGGSDAAVRPFDAVFIRAPVVEKVLAPTDGVQREEESRDGTVVAPSRTPKVSPEGLVGVEVEVLARLERSRMSSDGTAAGGDIIAVRQGNVLGTSFHPELTGDCRIHVWWLRQVQQALGKARQGNVNIPRA
ncbi:MAG: hypothetical protein M1825_004320 [Sarcosagium campestre]|nr:MAG: hypothetical protein M1825_004320 [Sarcosagium campestre]